jgi:hypothetical protein
MNDKYLPLGSILKIKNVDAKIMIMGFCPGSIVDGEAKFFDYSGCSYPIGVLTSSINFCFNHDDIVNVLFVPEVDQEFKDWNKYLNNLDLDKIKDNAKIVLNHKNEVLKDTLVNPSSERNN